MATNNAINTPKITLGGPFTISGAFTTTFTVTGNTSITLPTSGTLALAGANSDITSMTGLTGVLQAPTFVNDSSGNHILGFNTVASAVNYVTVTSASAAAATVGFAAAGTSGTVNIAISSKSGSILFQDTTVAAITKYYNAGNTHFIGLQAGTLAADTTFTLPTADGVANRPMLTNGSGAFIFTPSSAGVDIVGTTTNGNAVAGSVGEFISSVIPSASAVTFANNTNTDLTSISLIAGDWDVWGNLAYVTLGSVPTEIFGWISSTSATTPDSSLYNTIAVNAITSNLGIIAPQLRFSLSSPTTIYISGAKIGTSGNATVCGGIYARRRR